MTTKEAKQNKGFTLVELIVVLVILAILAAILIPALLGYIDRARQQENVRKIHEMQIAATSALVEYHGLHEGKEGYGFTLKTYKVNGRNVNAYNITNYTFARLQESSSSGNLGSDSIAREMLKYLESNKGNSKKVFTFKSYNSSPYGKKAGDIAKAGAEGLIILFGKDCKLLMIQYSDLDGNLYTYDCKTGQIDIEENGTFIADGTKV